MRVKAIEEYLYFPTQERYIRKKSVEVVLEWCQCGFRLNRCVMDLIFTMRMRMRMEKWWEWGKRSLYGIYWFGKRCEVYLIQFLYGLINRFFFSAGWTRVSVVTLKNTYSSQNEQEWVWWPWRTFTLPRMNKSECNDLEHLLFPEWTYLLDADFWKVIIIICFYLYYIHLFMFTVCVMNDIWWIYIYFFIDLIVVYTVLII